MVAVFTNINLKWSFPMRSFFFHLTLEKMINDKKIQKCFEFVRKL